MKSCIWVIICSAIISIRSVVSLAQVPTAPPSTEPSKATTNATVSPESANFAQGINATKPAAATTRPCVPQCRSGFLCLQGICVSACNPPCAEGFQCTAAAHCVPPPSVATVPAPIPNVTDKNAELKKRRQEKLALRQQYRSIPRISFSTDGALGTLKDGNVLEASFHIGLGFRKNIMKQFGVIAGANLIVGIWNDERIPTIELDYDAQTSTNVIGFDVELLPYFGPFTRFYVGPAVNLRGMYPHKNRLDVEIDPYYGPNQTIHFEDTLFLNYGVGAGVLLGSKESININGRMMSSFTQRMPLYIQLGISYDLPIEGDK